MARLDHPGIVLVYEVGVVVPSGSLDTPNRTPLVVFVLNHIDTDSGPEPGTVALGSVTFDDVPLNEPVV